MEHNSTHRPGLGINPGHGFAKIVLLTDDHAPQTIIIPALVGQAERQLAGAVQRMQNVDVGGRAWWVGEDALLAANTVSALNQQRIKDPVFIPALIKGALQRMASTGSVADELIQSAMVVTGLPATWSTDRELAHALVQRLKEAASLGKVQVIAEPLGLIYATVFDDAGEISGDPVLTTGKVAVIDLGHHTVDVAIMERLVPVPASLVTYQLGTARPFHIVQQRIAARYEVELPLYEVDQIVRRGVITIAGEVQPLPDGWDQPVIENGKDIARKLGDAWAGQRLDAILIGGGGAEVPALVEAIQSRFKHARTIPHGQLAVALGYARLARRLGRFA